MTLAPEPFLCPDNGGVIQAFLPEAVVSVSIVTCNERALYVVES